ncbi:hypothetical protein [Streptomyces vinaceus]|uniref:hypothetical protein n=1 Tax=Streptomyces vinaceus TaxID=1960 RepID=UPI0036A27536
MSAIWSSDCSFTLWQYGIGHSRLILKASSNSSQSLGILFEGVDFVKLTRVFPRLSISRADVAQEREMDDAGVRSVRPLLRLALRHDRGTGLVACSRLTVGTVTEIDGRTPFELHPIHLSIRA